MQFVNDFSGSRPCFWVVLRTPLYQTVHDAPPPTHRLQHELIALCNGQFGSNRLTEQYPVKTSIFVVWFG